jgi:hypothetical protein
LAHSGEAVNAPENTRDKNPRGRETEISHPSGVAMQNDEKI